MGKVIRFVKQETVLSVAAVLAAASAFAVPPDAGYAGYIDWRTMAILFSLMTVMAGLRRQGVFDRMGRALLALTWWGCWWGCAFSAAWSSPTTSPF